MILAQPGVQVDIIDTFKLNDDSAATDDPEDDNIELLLAEFSSDSRHKRVPKASALHYACMSNNNTIVSAIGRDSTDFLWKDGHEKVPMDYIDGLSFEGIEALRAYGAAYEQWNSERNRKLFHGNELCQVLNVDV